MSRKKRKGNWFDRMKDEVLSPEPATWAFVIQVMDPQKDGSSYAEIIQVEIRGKNEGSARVEAINVAHAQYPDAQGFRLMFAVELDKDGKPVESGLEDYWPTAIIADGEVANLDKTSKKKELAVVASSINAKPSKPRVTTRPPTVYKPALRDLLSKEAIDLMSQKYESFEYTGNIPSRRALATSTGDQ